MFYGDRACIRFISKQSFGGKFGVVWIVTVNNIFLYLLVYLQINRMGVFVNLVFHLVI